MSLGMFIGGCFFIGIGGWIFFAVQWIQRMTREAKTWDDDPTIEFAPLNRPEMQIAPFEGFGPGKPAPPSPEVLEEFWWRAHER